MQRGLHAAAIERRTGAMRGLQATVAVGEQQFGMAVQRPEAPQGIERRLRQGYKTIPVALGVPDVHSPAFGIDVADLEPALAKLVAVLPNKVGLDKKAHSTSTPKDNTKSTVAIEDLPKIKQAQKVSQVTEPENMTTDNTFKPNSHIKTNKDKK